MPRTVRNFAAFVLEMLESGDIDGAKRELRHACADTAHAGGRHHVGANANDLAASVSALALGVRFLGSREHSPFNWSGTLTQCGTAVSHIDDDYLEVDFRAPGIGLTGDELQQVREVIASAQYSLFPARQSLVNCSRYTPLRAITHESQPDPSEGALGGTDESRELGRRKSHLFYSHLLRVQHARAAVADRVEARLMVLAQDAGATQRQIAEAAGSNQTAVNRRIRSARADPRTILVTPLEIYDHYVAGEFDRATLVSMLAAYPYEKGAFPDDGRDEGYIPGSMDQLTQLVLDGSLKREEFELVLEGIDALADAHGRG